MRVVLVAGAALALAGAVLAAGPSPVAQQGSRGVVAPGGKIRYVTLARSGGTVVAARPVRGRRVLRSARLAGVWGIPTVTWNGDTAGVSADGRTLVLASAVGTAQLRKTTRFPVLDAQTLRLRKIVTLRGHYSFDALSPNGRMLYLIHNVSRTDLGRYTVVAYDLPFDRLTRRIVDDRRRSEWSMTGSPIARATAPDGGWAYTFYMGGEGKLPFVHALDTRHAKAVCIDIPWRGRREDLWKIRMTLRGSDLVVKLARKPIFVVDTKTYRVSRASP